MNSDREGELPLRVPGQLACVKRRKVWKAGIFDASYINHSNRADVAACVLYLKPVDKGQPVAATSRRLLSFVLQVVWNQGFLELSACPWDMGLEVISSRLNTADDSLNSGWTGTVVPLTRNDGDFEFWLKECHTLGHETLCWSGGAWTPGRSVLVKWHEEGIRYYKGDFKTCQFDIALKPRLPGGQPVAAAPVVPSTKALREWAKSYILFMEACSETQRRGKWEQKIKKKIAWRMFQRHEKLALDRARGAFHEIMSIRALFL